MRASKDINAALDDLKFALKALEAKFKSSEDRDANHLINQASQSYKHLNLYFETTKETRPHQIQKYGEKVLSELIK